MPPASAENSSSGLRPTAAAATAASRPADPASSPPPPQSPSKPRLSSSLRSIDWRFARAHLPWLQLLAVVAVTGIILIGLEAAGKPRKRPFDVYDASISYSYHPDTVPTLVAFFVPVLAWLLTVAAVEFSLAAKRVGRSGSGAPEAFTAAATAALYHTLDVVCCLLLTALVTEATKLGVGRLRPYFLSACTPTEAAAPDGAVAKLSIGDARPPCNPVPGIQQRNARVSYPSGHSSTSMCTCAFTAFYVVWAVLFRGNESGAGGEEDDAERGGDRRESPPPTTPWSQTSDFLRFVAVLWSLVLVGSPWVIGASRITDNRHHPSDVVAGLGLGLVVAGFFFARSVSGRMALPECSGAEGGGEGVEAAASSSRGSKGKRGKDGSEAQELV